MPMNQGDAAAANTILRWMAHDPAIDADTAYRCAEQLAAAVHKVFGTGVRPDELAAARRRLSPDLATLLASCWSIEESDGGWPGADTVDIVTQLLDSAGALLTHPAVQADPDDPHRKAWEYGDLLAYATDHATDKATP